MNSSPPHDRRRRTPIVFRFGPRTKRLAGILRVYGSPSSPVRQSGLSAIVDHHRRHARDTSVIARGILFLLTLGPTITIEMIFVFNFFFTSFLFVYRVCIPFILYPCIRVGRADSTRLPKNGYTNVVTSIL